MIEPHPKGQAHIGDVLHACPECPIGNARPFCPHCLGTGLLDEAQLRRWQYLTMRDVEV